MDFVSGLPITPKKKDAIWVVIDRLTKSAHSIPVCTYYSLDRLLSCTFLKLFGYTECHYLLFLIGIRDLHQALGSKLNFNIDFHPQTDGQTERVIQILEDMLRCCILEFEGSWEKYLPLIEFAYNNSFQTSIRMGPYETLYGRKCQTPLY
ncbi:Gag protease polyprotein [Gossypium australe]|uniref:Gag protease polyprotein n=1 Tax=Gossypium australe TaxID=47621 RepID=A0A5B6WH24_9ROSI|nr:Gag protease polyprotein [Gossypium australe]